MSNMEKAKKYFNGKKSRFTLGDEYVDYQTKVVGDNIIVYLLESNSKMNSRADAITFESDEPYIEHEIFWEEPSAAKECIYTELVYNIQRKLRNYFNERGMSVIFKNHIPFEDLFYVLLMYRTFTQDDTLDVNPYGDEPFANEQDPTGYRCCITNWKADVQMYLFETDQEDRYSYQVTHGKFDRDRDQYRMIPLGKGVMEIKHPRNKKELKIIGDRFRRLFKRYETVVLDFNLSL